MARQKFIYRQDKDGNPKAVPVYSVLSYDKDDVGADFDSRTKKALYRLECDQGSRFRVGNLSKNYLKKVWDAPVPSHLMNYEH